MKTLILSILFLLSLNCYSQKIEDTFRMNEPIYLERKYKSNSTAGNELVIGANHFQVGIVLQIVGIGILTLSKNDPIFIGPVIGLNIIGIIFFIESQSHTRKAGKLLNGRF